MEHIATIRLTRDNHIVFEGPQADHIRSLIEESERLRGGIGPIFVEKKPKRTDGKAFMEMLKYEFNGTYLWASDVIADDA